MLVGCDAENNRQKTSTGFSEGFYRDYIQLLGSKVEVLYIDLWNFILMEVFVNLGGKIALYLSHIYDNFHQYKILGSYLGILCHVVSNANKIVFTNVSPLHCISSDRRSYSLWYFTTGPVAQDIICSLYMCW